MELDVYSDKNNTSDTNMDIQKLNHWVETYIQYLIFVSLSCSVP